MIIIFMNRQCFKEEIFPSDCTAANAKLKIYVLEKTNEAISLADFEK